MTGIECLQQELLNQGFTRKQTESKVLIGALGIISKNPDRYSEEDRLLEEVKQLKERKTNLEETVNEYERKYRVCKSELDSIIMKVNEEADRQYKQTKEYIDSFFKAIEECETPEGRDAIKTAQMFVNSVNVNTKYDNTSFIIGLATILAQGNIAPIERLQKINEKIPKVYFQAQPFCRYNGGRSLQKYQQEYNVSTREVIF